MGKRVKRRKRNLDEELFPAMLFLKVNRKGGDIGDRVSTVIDI
jgi:hypothetical protein